MVELSRYTGRLAEASRLAVRQEEVGGNGGDSSLEAAAAQDPTPSTLNSPAHTASFKPSAAAIVGIVSAVLIVTGLGEFSPLSAKKP